MYINYYYCINPVGILFFDLFIIIGSYQLELITHKIL